MAVNIHIGDFRETGNPETFRKLIVTLKSLGLLEKDTSILGEEGRVSSWKYTSDSVLEINSPDEIIRGWLDTKVKDLIFGAKIKPLIDADIVYVGDLVQKPYKDFEDIRNFGKKSRVALEEALHRLSKGRLTFGMKIWWWERPTD
ncbi:MAG: hypothetical protein OXR68_06985 [Alphaproteobacteria bacterium]|nr:hypothetical protein [Alphaproteobacteria bacterium]